MISIITPTHKQCPLLEYTIISVLGQSFKMFEWIVLDNSPDRYFKKYLDAFKLRYKEFDYDYSKIHIIEGYDGYSIGALKNICVRNTSCKDNEYVLLLDHDDILDKDALLRINEMACEYPDASWISGHQIVMHYDGNTLNSRNDLDPHNIKNQGLELLSGNVVINIGHITLDFGYCKNYAAKYYDVHFPGGSEQESNLFLSNKIASHPRCVKKHVLLDPIYGFYEGHDVSEDHIQCMMLGKFLRGCYIEDKTVIHIIYDDAMNSSFMPVSEDCISSYNDMIINMVEFWSAYNKIFPHIPAHNRLLNIKET